MYEDYCIMISQNQCFLRLHALEFPQQEISYFTKLDLIILLLFTNPYYILQLLYIIENQPFTQLQSPFFNWINMLPHHLMEH